jgi:hypothetical protein
VRGDLDPSEVNSTESNAVVDRCGSQRDRDFPSGMQPDAGARHDAAERSLGGHQNAAAKG